MTYEFSRAISNVTLRS